MFIVFFSRDLIFNVVLDFLVKKRYHLLAKMEGEYIIFFVNHIQNSLLMLLFVKHLKIFTLLVYTVINHFINLLQILLNLISRLKTIFTHPIYLSLLFLIFILIVKIFFSNNLPFMMVPLIIYFFIILFTFIYCQHFINPFILAFCQ